MLFQNFFDQIDNYDLKKLIIITYSPLLASLIKKQIIQKYNFIPTVKTQANWFDDPKLFTKRYISRFEEILLIIRKLKKLYNFSYQTGLSYAKKIQQILENDNNTLQNNITYEYMELIQNLQLNQYYSYRDHIKDIIQNNTSHISIISLYMPSTFQYNFTSYNHINIKPTTLQQDIQHITTYECNTQYLEALCCIEILKTHQEKKICCIIPDIKLLKIISTLSIQNKIPIYQILKPFNETRFSYIMYLSLISYNTESFLTLLQTLNINIHTEILSMRRKNKKYNYKQFIQLITNTETQLICEQIHQDLYRIQNLKLPLPFNIIFQKHYQYINTWPNIFNDIESQDIVPASLSELTLLAHSMKEYQEILTLLSSSINVTYKQNSSQVFFCSPYEALVIQPETLILSSLNTSYWPKETEELENEYSSDIFYKLCNMKAKTFITFNTNNNKSNLLFHFHISKWQQQNKINHYKKIVNPITTSPYKKNVPQIIYATNLNLFINDTYKFYLKNILRIKEIQYYNNQHSIIGSIIHEFAHNILNKTYDMNIYITNKIDAYILHDYITYHTKYLYQTKLLKQININNLFKTVNTHTIKNIELSRYSSYSQILHFKHPLYTKPQMSYKKQYQHSIEQILSQIIIKYKYQQYMLPRIIFLAQQWLKYYQDNIDSTQHTIKSENIYSFKYKNIIFKSKIDLILNNNIFIDYKTTNSVTIKKVQEGLDWQLLIPYLINDQFKLQYVLLSNSKTIEIKNLNKQHIYNKLDEIIIKLNNLTLSTQ